MILGGLRQPATREPSLASRLGPSGECQAQESAPWEGPLTAQEQAMIDAAWEHHKAAAPQKEMEMTDEQIKHMVNRFLAWRLPDNFNPDAGISFTPDYNIFTANPKRHEPMGTNLFDATQAEAMVRHMLDGMPA